MAAKTHIEIQNDERGRIVYDRSNKDFAVFTPAGQLLGYATTRQAADATLDAWHYEEAQAAQRAAVTAALDEYTADIDATLASYVGKELDAADKEEQKYWQAQQRAFAKAALHHSEGIAITASGAGYVVPSASRPGAVVHRLYQVGEVWTCGCEAGQNQRFCWHAALLHCHLRACELADRVDPLEAQIAA